jgi:hypothetical protein
MSVPYLACMALVAAFYHLPPRVLPAIQAVEGGRPGIVAANLNGTQDLGVMQVNTIWLAPLASHARLSEAAVRDRLIHQSCFNIAAAGLILRTYLDEEGDDLMHAIGDYHSHTAGLNRQYQSQVWRAATRLFVGSHR